MFQVAVGLHQDSLIASLGKMTPPLLPAVEIGRIAHILHPFCIALAYVSQLSFSGIALF
jgi:hypothetical protein